MNRTVSLLIVSLVLVAPASTVPQLGSDVAEAATPSWQQTFDGNFIRLSTTTWTRYNGVPRCCSNTIWAPSHLVARGGVVNLETYRDPAYHGRRVSAGMSMGRSLNQTYGRWSLRFRMDKGRGVGMCVALWPQNGWPPEIDFAEESSVYGGRGVQTATLHYSSRNLEIHRQVFRDFTKWHNMGVEWMPGKIVYMLDGRPWASVSGSMVPHQPMHLTIQTHVGSNGSTGVLPDSTTPAHVNMQIDWVRVYKYVP